jgi:hypothetical protein
MLPLNPLMMKHNLFYLKTLFVPCSKHSHLSYKTESADVVEGKFAVCSEIYRKHINAPCRQNVELLNVNPEDMYRNVYAIKGKPSV